jgi:uncharacterized membrane protein YhhN
MFWKILFILVVAAEFVFVPLFLKFSWPKKCWKSMGYKMICSALFFVAGLLAVKISHNHTPYATLILWGLALGWVGDFFLHLITDKVWVFGIGLFAFLGGHICYILAFQRAIRDTYPQYGFFRWYEIPIILAVVALFALYAWKKQIKAKLYLAIPVALYALTITTMLVKAIRYCCGQWWWGLHDHIPMLFVTVGLGAVLFVLSDASLGLILFAGKDKNRPLKWFNIGTYYAAQILLASSIFFITVRL